MTAGPDVSVVVPTHERRDLLLRTLASVRAQTGVGMEILVVDDGSSDGTADAVDELGDERISVLRNDVAQGVSAARNRGTRAATGTWVAWCDDDDLWAPDKLARQLEAAAAAGRQWAYTGAVNVTLADAVSGGAPPLDPDEIVARLPASNVVPGGCSGVAVHRDVVDAIGGFDEALGPLADWDLWLRLRDTGPPAGVLLPLVGYRVHQQNMSLDDRRLRREFATVAQRNPDASWALLYRYLGWWSLRANRYGRAAVFFLRSSWRADAWVRRRDPLLDLGYLVAKRAAAAGLRPGERYLRRRAEEVSEEVLAWREEAQRWIDASAASSRPG